MFAGYSWHPPLAGVPRDRAVDAYRRVFADRPHADLASVLQRRWQLDHDPSGRRRRHGVAFTRDGRALLVGREGPTVQPRISQVPLSPGGVATLLLGGDPPNERTRLGAR